MPQNLFLLEVLSLSLYIFLIPSDSVPWKSGCGTYRFRMRFYTLPSWQYEVAFIYLVLLRYSQRTSFSDTISSLGDSITRLRASSCSRLQINRTFLIKKSLTCWLKHVESLLMLVIFTLIYSFLIGDLR